MLCAEADAKQTHFIQRRQGLFRRQAAEERKKTGIEENLNKVLNRATKNDEWVTFNVVPPDPLAFRMCASFKAEGECCYGDEVKRLGDLKQLFRLKGFDNMFLCDLCLSSPCITEVIENRLETLGFSRKKRKTTSSRKL